MSAVLIVEDERGVRQGLVAAIETLGHRALPAGGLGEARQLLMMEYRRLHSKQSHLEAENVVLRDELRLTGTDAIPGP